MQRDARDPRKNSVGPLRHAMRFFEPQQVARAAAGCSSGIHMVLCACDTIKNTSTAMLWGCLIGWGTRIRTSTACSRGRCTTIIRYPNNVVPMKRFELLRGHPHYALNVARLPVPPHRLILLPLLNLHDSRGVCQMKFDVGAINPRHRCNGSCIDTLMAPWKSPIRSRKYEVTVDGVSPCPLCALCETPTTLTLHFALVRRLHGAFGAMQ